MTDSILTSIKKLLGITAEDISFDPDIIMHINSVFMVLNQLGVGPTEGFSIEDKDTEWSDYIGNSKDLNAVKSYMHLKVKMLFDPPLSQAVKDAMNQSIAEFEWRLNAGSINK